MSGYLVDSNVFLDLLLEDPVWAEWSEKTLAELGKSNALYINAIIFTEVSIGFSRIEVFEKALRTADFEMLDMPKEALFLAGKVFLNYRRNAGKKVSPLPDFYIGAHAAVTGIGVITRDSQRIRTYFPTVEIISPH